MLCSYRQSLSSPVFTFRDGEIIGSLHDIIIEPLNGKIAGLIVFAKPSGRRFKTYAVSAGDILEWKKQIIIQDEDDLSETEEIVRLNQIIKNEGPLIGKPVYTETEAYLGKVYDFLFNPDFLQMTKLVVRRREWLVLTYDCLIPLELIVEIKPEQVIVKDGLIKKTKFREKIFKPLPVAPVPA
jgi:sporulation protein YlmC with PRC-barrel domain